MQAARTVRPVKALVLSAALTALGLCTRAQAQQVPSAAPALEGPAVASPVLGSPIAIVPLESGSGSATVTGALEVTAGKAIITASGTVTSGLHTTDVSLPHRGTLRVCASTTVKLAVDSNVAAGEVPGLLVALDHGAVEMSFATLQDADFLLTPDFRILIGGPGSSEVKVRLGSGGDTCVDNPGADAPYVVVSSLFGDGVYRVQPGQRVMFQHGNLHEVVDQEKEPCGCPPKPFEAQGNEFPLAQSEGLAPTPPPAPSTLNQESAATQVPPLVYTSPAATAQPSAPVPTTPAQGAAPAQGPKQKHPNLFTRFGNFLKRVFGAE